MSSLLKEEMQRVLFTPEGQQLKEFIEISETAPGRHFLCVSGTLLSLPLSLLLVVVLLLLLQVNSETGSLFVGFKCFRRVVSLLGWALQAGVPHVLILSEQRQSRADFCGEKPADHPGGHLREDRGVASEGPGLTGRPGP